MRKSEAKNLKHFLKEIDKIQHVDNLSSSIKSDLEKVADNLQSLELRSFTWLENSPICTKIIDADFNLRYMSKSGVQAMKIKDINSYYGQPYPLNSYSDPFRISMKKCLNKAKKHQQSITHEAPILDLEGNEYWYQSNIIPIMDINEQLDYFLVVSIDITERKQNELAVLKSRDFNESLLKTSPNIIYVYDLVEKRSIYNNNGNTKILGYTSEEIYEYGDTLIQHLLHPEDFQTFENSILKQYESAEDGDIIEFIFRAKHKKGHWVWLHSRESVFKRDAQNKPIQIIGVSGDITDQKIAEERLNQSRDRFKKTFDLSPSIIGTIDINTNKFIDTNEAVTRILGYTHEEFTAQPFYTFIHPDDLERTSKNVSEKLEGRNFEIFENRYLCKNGNYKWIAWQGTKPDENGIVTAIGSDITAKKQQETILNLLNDVAKSILGKINLSEISWIIVNKVADYLNTKDCVIYYIDKTTNNLEQIAAYGAKITPEFQIKNKISVPLGKGIVGAVAQSGVGEVVNNTTQDNRYIIDDEKRFSEITVPIIFEGNVIGIIDSEHYEKNFYTEENLRTLESIADLISIQLNSAINFRERERSEQRAKDNQELLKVTGAIAKVGGWELNLVTNELKWTDETKRVHEVPLDFVPEVETAIHFYHPEDREMVRTHVNRAIEFGEQYAFEARIITPSGKEKHVRSQGRAVSENGKPVRIYGAFQDITEQKRIELELEIYRKELEIQNIQLKKEISLSFNYENMVYSSDLMSNLLTQVEQVAQTDATVLILGETGTGKELIARAIHNTSKRKQNSLIRVNCATIPAELIESELFGHKKGSFTGAIDNRIGKFELANGGTIFLDEIGELPLHLQPKLLRAIQEGEIEPIGSSTLKKLDVRIIAATNRDLKHEISQNRFREDLYYRLNVFPIKVPALRERTEDIPVLIDYFVNKYGKKHGKTVTYISDDILQQMKTYAWPGNIRELENLSERAIIVSPEDLLLIPEFNTSSKTKSKIGNYTATLAEVQRNHIIKILNQTHWKIDGEQGAAKLLDLKPSTLRDRMKKLGIKRIHS
jgi:PAS domain S-box-containing protein